MYTFFDMYPRQTKSSAKLRQAIPWQDSAAGAFYTRAAEEICSDGPSRPFGLAHLDPPEVGGGEGEMEFAREVIGRDFQSAPLPSLIL